MNPPWESDFGQAVVPHLCETEWGESDARCIQHLGDPTFSAATYTQMSAPELRAREARVLAKLSKTFRSPYGLGNARELLKQYQAIVRHLPKTKTRITQGRKLIRAYRQAEKRNAARKRAAKVKSRVTHHSYWSRR